MSSDIRKRAFPVFDDLPFSADLADEASCDPLRVSRARAASVLCVVVSFGSVGVGALKSHCGFLCVAGFVVSHALIIRLFGSASSA